MSKTSLPTTHEIDEIFGDGENTVRNSLGYYLWGMVNRPNSIAHELSNDANLYRIGWKVAFLVLISELILGYAINKYASVYGFITRDEFNESLGYLVFGAPLYLVSYFIIRFIWVSIFRYGTDFSDRRIAAASASSVGVGIWITPITYLVTSVLFSLPSSYWYLGGTAFENASMLAFFLSIPVSVGFTACYFRDVLKISTAKAFGWTLASFIIVVIVTTTAVIGIAFAIGSAFPE